MRAYNVLLISKTIGWSALNQFKVRNNAYVKEQKTVNTLNS